ncbi:MULTISPECIES: methyltransferase [unclassified Streptomyces]|uniref:methyltransferase n=1 Tax=unclassified Streptomyces TaxID=2593676 RepID=UPI0029BF7AE5|nr:methyltransferase [Streptomyces sp. FL07-04A]MDX3575392.1 methyltransferase [Streptomyces sp. FL07-04A]
MTTPALPSLEARVKLYRIGMGFAALQFVQAAVDLKVADALDDEPLGAEELAKAVDADPDALGRLLRALSCHGFFEALEDGRFRHTELSRMIRQDSTWGAPDVIRFGWLHVPVSVLHHTADAVRTGEAAFPKVFGTQAQSYFVNDDPEAGAIFNRAMTANTILLNNAPALVAALAPRPGETVMDVGGGQGQLLLQLMEAYPDIHGVLLELEQVLPGVDERLRAGGALAARAELLAGDCRESVPGGADTYLYKHMMYMWDDDTVVAILRNTARAAASGARVVVVDMLLGGDSPFEEICTAVDLLMVLMGGGKRRSVDQFAALFEQAGLDYQGARSIEGDQSVLLTALVP